jgi:hypothetical protein
MDDSGVRKTSGGYFFRAGFRRCAQIGKHGALRIGCNDG